MGMGLPSFLWGVATSAYQVEGAPDNDWTEWEQLERLKVRGDTLRPRVAATASAGGPTSSCFPTLGANAYRYSLERSRIEPEPGQFCEDALAVERERAATLLRLGIEPCVTLNHYTHPRWFWERGRLGGPGGASQSFRRFTEAAADALGPRVRLWVTLNEPVVLLLGGYLGGEIPPGKRGFRAAARAFEHMLRAHVEAAAAIRERVPERRIGIAHNMLEFAPDRAGNMLDRRLARVGDRLYNTALLEAIATGDLAWSFPGAGPDARSDPGAAGRQRLRRRELLQPRPYPLPRPARRDRRVRRIAIRTAED